MSSLGVFGAVFLHIEFSLWHCNMEKINCCLCILEKHNFQREDSSCFVFIIYNLSGPSPTCV
jgi:hypothetical protein